MVRKSVEELGTLYISGKKAWEKYRVYLGGISLGAFYEMVNNLKFISAKINKRTVILERSIVEYIEKTEEERKNFTCELSLKEHWERLCKTFLGKWANVEEIGKILGICCQTIYLYIGVNRKKIMTDESDNGRGTYITYVNPIIILDMMKDVNE